MPISVFQIFKIGLGPSSSHTVGPMKAAYQFTQHLQARALLPKVRQVRTDLYGSLAATGKGHNTDRAVMLGLMGETPETVPIDAVDDLITQVKKTQKLSLMKTNPIQFVEREHIAFNFGKRLSYHTNGMKFTALGDNNEELFSKTFYSVGGGFIVDDATAAAGVDKAKAEAKVHIPFPFTTGDQLLQHCEQLHIHIKDVMMANEVAIGERKSADDVIKGLDRIWSVMSDCVARGMTKEGTLPGELKVRRRAGKLLRDLTLTDGSPNPTANLDWINLFALAVNEENAVGGRVVTAPTNGAAGVIPAVLHYYFKFHHGLSNCKGRSLTPTADFLLTAGAIGIIFKENASIAGADMGCQGEVGVASSMAAAGLTALLGGTPKQVENAAEIAMEHHLGLTCDPVGGLVQIPCIERNTFGAVKAINSATLALHGDGNHTVSLDRVVRVMKQTGLDMKVKYKETSLGGLAAEFRNDVRGKHRDRPHKAPEPAAAVAGDSCEVDLVHQDNVATAEC